MKYRNKVLMLLGVFTAITINMHNAFAYANGTMSYCLFDAVQEYYPDYFPKENAYSWTLQIGNDYAYIREYSSYYQSKLAVYNDGVYVSFYNQSYSYVFTFAEANRAFANNSCAGSTTINKPSAPSNLTTSTVSSSSIKLTWTDTSNNETGFHIYRYNGSDWVKITTVSSNQTSYTDNALYAATMYYYIVESYNSAGAARAYVSGNTSSAGSSSQTQGSYVEARDDGYNTLRGSPGVNNVYRGDDFGRLYMVYSGNDVIELPSTVPYNADASNAQIIYLMGVNEYWTGRETPRMIKNVRRTGNDLYFEHTGTEGTGSVTIKNYYIWRDIVWIYGNPNSGCDPWNP